MWFTTSSIGLKLTKRLLFLFVAIHLSALNLGHTHENSARSHMGARVQKWCGERTVGYFDTHIVVTCTIQFIPGCRSCASKNSSVLPTNLYLLVRFCTCTKASVCQLCRGWYYAGTWLKISICIAIAILVYHISMPYYFYHVSMSSPWFWGRMQNGIQNQTISFNIFAIF